MSDRPATALPPSSRTARRISNGRIPIAALPIEPTEAEIAECVAKLEDAALRDRPTMRARGRK